MVGGLADWFAVTALFRHPLASRSHTPRSSRAGRTRSAPASASSSRPTSCRARSWPSGCRRPAGARLAEWLARPGSAETVARHAADALGGGHRRAARRGGAGGDRGPRHRPAAGHTGLAAGGQGARRRHRGWAHHELVDTALRGFDRYLVDEHDNLRARFAEESPWWVPETIDDRIFEKIVGGLRGFIGEVVADPRHELRTHLDERLAETVERLQHDPTSSPAVRSSRRSCSPIPSSGPGRARCGPTPSEPWPSRPPIPSRRCASASNGR